MSAPATLSPEEVEASGRLLFALSYRITGSVADAEDIVQETWRRAIEHPPARTDEPWRPWLVRVATNLGLDLLRRRRRSPYKGPWLPAPLEDERLDRLEPAVERFPGAQHDLRRCVETAFLVVLESLSAKARAVFLLRDVFGYSVAETSAALAISEADVKTTLHRARAVVEGNGPPARPARERAPAVRAALERLVGALLAQDTAALEALLAEDVRATTDGGGEFAAALVPIVGRRKVARTWLKLTAKQPAGSSAGFGSLNGLPVLVVTVPAARKGHAPRLVLSVEVDDAGRIHRIHTVSASRKLVGVTFGGS